jgi:hypothetical protein
MRYIPGSDQEVPGEEKLSSLARFDALMRDAEERRRHDPQDKYDNAATQSAWDADNSEDDLDGEDGQDDEDEDDVPIFDEERETNRDTLIPATTQRALEFITGRSSTPRSPRSPSSVMSSQYHHIESLNALDPNGGGAYWPAHISHSKSRSMGHRAFSQQQQHSVPPSANLDVPSSSSGKTSEDGGSRSHGDASKRHSSSSTKRLSFTEFTKRLSSTSSLLLVQTNVSSGGASSRGSSELDQLPSPVPRGNLQPRTAQPPPNPRDREEWEKRCGWRGSVGVFGSEGGFL